MKPLFRTLACLLVICLCAPLFAHADQMTYEGPGWDTPEDAVRYYLEGLKEQDLGKMIGAYAVETYIDHFDLRAMLTRMGAYTPGMTPRLPSAGDLLRAINIEARKNEIVHSIQFQMTSICLPEHDFSRSIPFARDTIDEEVEAFVGGLEKAFGAIDFGTLNVLLFVPPEFISELYASESNQENIKRQIAPTGADEARSVVAVFAVGSKACVLFCDVMRYEDRWFMLRAQGNIGNLLGLSWDTGGLIAVSRIELLALWNELGPDVQQQLGMDIYDLLKLLGE